MLLESIDMSLLDLFGAKVRETTYRVLEQNYAIAREEIPRKVPRFASFLELVFGAAGPTIGRTILKNFYAKLGLHFNEKQGFKFQDYIKAVKS